MSSGHTKRVLTSVVAIPIVLLVIIKGGSGGTAVLVGLAAVLGLLEFYSLFCPKEPVFIKSLNDDSVAVATESISFRFLGRPEARHLWIADDNRAVRGFTGPHG